MSAADIISVVILGMTVVLLIVVLYLLRNVYTLTKRDEAARAEVSKQADAEH